MSASIAVSGLNDAPRPQRRARLRLATRVVAVLLASVLAHALVLLWAQRELDDAWNSLPPAAPIANVQLFVPTAPIAIGERAKPVRRAPERAITAPPASPPEANAPVEAAPEPPMPEAVAARTEPIADLPPVPPPSPVDKAVVAFPKFGRMTYAMFGGTGILRAEGKTVMEWRVSADRYEATIDTRLPDGDLLISATSSGEVRAASGIAPIRYTEKSRRRAAQAANFIWERREVTFSSTNVPAPLVDGTQDRLSFHAQLALFAQAFPDRFQSGAVIAMNVAGPRDVRLYDFRVTGWEAVRGDDGVIYDTLKLDRPMNPERPDFRIEVWLAPTLRWLPTRIRMTFANGNFGDMLIQEAKFDE